MVRWLSWRGSLPRRAREAPAVGAGFAGSFVRRVLAVIVAGAVFALLAWLVVKVLPAALAATSGITDASMRAEEIARTRTAILAILAGTFAAIGAYYTHKSFGLNRQGQLTDRFTRAVDQLGNPSLDVVLGGIYALERIARESRDDHRPIIEILTAYIRGHAPTGKSIELAGPTIAIQAALTVLGRRTISYDQGTRVNLSRADLSGANLSCANLSRADLTMADLSRAYLVGANLYMAGLRGADLVRADLLAANLSRADLITANLSEANLVGANLVEADLKGANLSGANLSETNLNGADLTEANLGGVRSSPGTIWPEGWTRFCPTETTGP